MGAWIEITKKSQGQENTVSLPSWERGLKLANGEFFVENVLVAPLVGAWIEIFFERIHTAHTPVAPLVGAWIEIIIIISMTYDTFVAPLVGAWIEIIK